MNLYITFRILMAECLVSLIVMAAIIQTSRVGTTVPAPDGRSHKDGSYLAYLAKWIIWGAILTISLGLSPNKPQEVLPKSIDNSTEVTPVKDLVATPYEATTEAACLKSPAIIETAPFMKSLPLEKRFLLKPLTHPKQVLSPHTKLQLNNGSSPLAPQHIQLKSNDLSERLLTKARHHLKTSYRRGGSLQTGNATDCSGFVQYIYKEFDINLPRSSSEQAQEGKVAAHTMDFSKLIPGDLLFFSPGRRHINHVGIYLGDGKMIHAAGHHHGVVVSDLRKPYYRGNFVVAKRILNDKHYQ
jgi:cell wall-associated NlpC family hydrolase